MMKATNTVITVRNVVAERLCFHRRLWFCSQGEGCVSQNAPGQTPLWADISQHAPGQTPPPSMGRHIPACTEADKVIASVISKETLHTSDHFAGNITTDSIWRLSRLMRTTQTPPGQIYPSSTGANTPHGQTYPSMHWGTHSPLSRHIPACTGADPAPPPTATAADGTHPTGMHSC